jgi:glycosyltransferase involved in cell wall biosynthesis
MDSKVSIVLCGYNQAAYLAGAIESVLSQTHRNFEVLIIDNGSTDGSQELLKNYRTDPRVRLLVHAHNDAVTKRMNEAVALSSGQYVSLLLADDYYLPQKLERQLQEFSKLTPDYGVVYSPGYRLDAQTGQQWVDNTVRSSGAILKDMLLRSHDEGFINPIALLMRRECLIRYPFREELFTEGEAILLRIAMSYKFQFVDEPLTVMREHATNMGKAIKRNAAAVSVILDELSKEPDFPRDLMPALNTYRANSMALFGWLAIRMAADPAWARDCLVSAIKLRPSYIGRPRALAGLVLSLLPAPAVRRVNTALNAMRGHKETIAVKADYA